jgi:hypothetical protein
MSAAVAAPAAAHETAAGRPALPAWWPLAALTLLAAALRLSTLDLQSFWYDEAFTPVHVLHPSLLATLRSVVHTENTPPLWYVIAWADARVFGTGEVALRLPSAIAGIATVPVAWAIGRELTARRATAIAAAAFVAVNPLFVWYSQEARAYGLFVFTSALAMLCFLRALHGTTPRRLTAFAVTASLALLSHYFAAFLVAPMIIMLLFRSRLPWLEEYKSSAEGEAASARATPLACGAVVLVGLALLPLASAQGGHGAQWIGEWALTSRLEAIPQYYLTGYSGSPLGHGIELLVALPILAGVGVAGQVVLRDRFDALRERPFADPLCPVPALREDQRHQRHAHRRKCADCNQHAARHASRAQQPQRHRDQQEYREVVREQRRRAACGERRQPPRGGLELGAQEAEHRQCRQQHEQRVCASLLRVPDEQGVHRNQRGGYERGAAPRQLPSDPPRHRDRRHASERRRESQRDRARAEQTRPRPDQDVPERRGVLSVHH